MVRQPPKCCCCIPMRPGLLAWAYIKLVLAITSIGAFLYFSRPWHDYYYYRSEHQTAYLVELLPSYSVLLVYTAFTILFIIGVHRENSKLLLVFLVYSIFEVILAGVVVGWQLYAFGERMYYLRHDQFYDSVLHRYINDPLFYLRLIGPVVINILLPIYFMVLIKSELRRLKMSRRGPRVVLNQPVAIGKDKRYNFGYIE